MKTNEIRQKYLEYYESQGHQICASDVLVPKWDPTVLFTPAGMNPFKDHFLGKVNLEFTRATSCQKCLRTGDIENVGRTAYHHTFFEMLGNFSFGDYFKEEAIVWAWEFLTGKEWLGISPEKLTVTVYQDDDEAEKIWHQKVGLPLDRITRLGEHDNFWPAGAPTDGPDGVCGPCSEIFYQPDNGPECEIWNLVFTQFNRAGDPPNNLTPLPSNNIDTGMGLERMAAMMQGVETNYHIDSLLPLVLSSAEACGTRYEPNEENGRRIRRIADHVRACTMAIHENVHPGNQKENYVIRRLLRRAVLQGHEMGIREPFLYQIVPTVVDIMGHPYPEMKGSAENIAYVIRAEEERFLNTLDAGLTAMERLFTKMQSSGEQIVSGRKAFDLYQEQGIPAELFESLAKEKGFGFDWEGFEKSRDQHAIDSGAGEVGVMGDFGPIDDIKRKVKLTEFSGYGSLEDNGTVCGLVHADQVVESLEKTEDLCLLVLDRTPFYAESGGQVGDSGVINGPNGSFSVSDVQKNGDLFVHHGHVTSGCINQGDSVTGQVDQVRRTGIERAHTATHILHFALQKYLGEHAQQRGSKVEADQLRFDFANNSAISAEVLNLLEKEAQHRITEAEPVQAEVLPMEDARSQGAMMLFGEKYPDPVRMVSIGEYSKELCGGTHVQDTGQIAAIELIAEEAVSTGVRRIVALTGDRAENYATEIRNILEESASLLNVAPTQVHQTVLEYLNYAKALKKQLGGGKEAELNIAADTDLDELTYPEIRDLVKQTARALNVQFSGILDRLKSLLHDIDGLKQQIEEMVDTSDLTSDALWERAFILDDINVVVSETPGANPDLMRKLIDQLRKKYDHTAIFLAAAQGSQKIMLLAGLSKDLVERGYSAGDWVKQVAPTVGGGGGGRPDMAQAGGKQPEKLNVALDAAREYMQKLAAK